ncbi:precorrin-2 C(20)-methyltransferase [Kaistia algarum]|uniref:precorrin-2 C(20)-methyltransferase n=1 Tax=Kaistia algarum TaxID=2083279 RepID=UPI000CE79C78|nr:precorrin-2 C(20)-methyltransferase [Kaistia algarum]MCX5513081.1 precorrin-2 C(20)-methyltransferase [Kaistia algarum]PPE81444.1 precorrin-2 C(20)-methyltransferase [Kaistia algarum]
MSGTGKLIGVGVGPGDPELLTLKAVRAIESADLVAYFAKAGNQSNARAIVADRLVGVAELPLLYPVTTEIHRHDPAYRSAIGGFYEQAAATIASHLEAGRRVAVLSEGDPLFYGSYMHIHCRLAPRFASEVIPGVTGMSGGWSGAGVPIAQGDDVTTILPGTLDEDELARRFAGCDAAIVMKLGRNLAKVRCALQRAGKLGRALYVERATTAEAVILPLADKPDDAAPYFSMILVPGWTGEPKDAA